VDKLPVTHFDLIVIGGGVAGIQAALWAKKLQPSKSIALVSDETIMYSRPSLTAVISGAVRDVGKIEIYPPQNFKDSGVHLLSKLEILKIQHSTHTVSSRKKGCKQPVCSPDLAYGKLILATGATPSVPEIEGLKLRGVFTIRRFEEALATSNFISSGMTAHVVGAGFVGLDAAEALARRGLDVTLIVRSRILRGILEQDLSEALVERAQKYGVRILNGTALASIGGHQKVEHLVIEGKTLKTDIVVFATGVEPETKLAQSMGLALAKNGAIRTDEKMQTSLDGVYATGDCSATIDFVSQEQVYRPLGSIAAFTAQIAGANAVGVEETYKGIIRKQYNRIFDTEIVSVGLSTEEAKMLGIKARALKCTTKKPQMLPFSQLTKNLMRVIVEEDTNIIIGWQTIGIRQSSFFNQYFCGCISDKRKLEDIESSGLRTDLAFEEA